MMRYLLSLLLFIGVLQCEEMIEKAPKVSQVAVHTIETAGYLGSSLTLDDGSFWSVKACDRAQLREWREKGRIHVVLTPNENWIFGTDYHFALYNVDADKQIEVRLEQPPELNKSSFVTLLDSVDCLLEIVDSNNAVTIWHVSWWDRNLLANWAVGDAVMIGGTVQWYDWKNPYALFNVKTGDYVRGQLYLKDQN